jgi:hypothetical protein
MDVPLIITGNKYLMSYVYIKLFYSFCFCILTYFRKRISLRVIIRVLHLIVFGAPVPSLFSEC